MIDLIDVSVQFGGTYLFDDVNLKINKNDKVALVGSNGSGKSTLLKMLYGLEQPESGNINKQKGISLGYLAQEFSELADLPLKLEVKNSISFIADIESQEDNISLKLEDSSLSEEEKNQWLERLGNLEHLKSKYDYYSFDSRLEKVLMGLGFSENDFGRVTSEFSGGWQMRIQLAKILLSQNDIILLDEPTNHLDIDSLEWLINYLKNYTGSIITVSHDRFFVDEITNKTLEIFNRKISFYNGNYSAYLRFKDERDKQLIASFESQQKKIKETQKFIERFRYKASKAKQVQSRVKQLEKLDSIDLPDFEKEINIKFPDPPKSGSIALEIKTVSKSFGDKKVFKNIDLQLERGEKIAFVGPNGAGKTTLSRIIADKLKATSGEVVYGHNTFISYYAQEVADNLPMSYDILDAVSEIAEKKTPGELRTLLGSFLFSDDDIFKKISILSGGEKSRVALARILLQKANIIVLDEPTNHLDFNSKKVLQQAIVNYSGTLIIVSHDVDFLRPIVNKVLEIRDGGAQLFYGGIDYYLSKREGEIQERNSVIQNENSKTVVNRKDQKRIEAELRKEKHVRTKNLKVKVEALEKEIEELEGAKDSTEAELGKEEVFSNPELSREKNAEYDKIKTRLEKVYSEWEELSLQLDEIEEEYRNLLP